MPRSLPEQQNDINGERMALKKRPVALITGAAGGIGTATARLLGMTMDLVLTDVHPERLASLKASLETDGVTVLACPAGMLQDEAVVEAVMSSIPEDRAIDVLVHSAGLASVQGGWRASVEANVIGTRRIVDAADARMSNGGVAILVSSIAGHANVPTGEADRLIERWDSPTLLDDLEPLLVELDESERSGRCYMLAKRMILRLCERLSLDWAKRGIRIVSVSPGLVDTPMGRAEANQNPAAAGLLPMVPLGAFVQPNDVAAAIGFLASPSARFITGCDLKVDGGLQAAIIAATMAN